MAMREVGVEAKDLVGFLKQSEVFAEKNVPFKAIYIEGADEEPGQYGRAYIFQVNGAALRMDIKGHLDDKLQESNLKRGEEVTAVWFHAIPTNKGNDKKLYKVQVDDKIHPITAPGFGKIKTDDFG